MRHFAWHQQRIARTLRENGYADPPAAWYAALAAALNAPPLAAVRERLHVDYDASTWRIAVSPAPNTPIQSLRIAHDNRISYCYKWRDRHELDGLFGRRDGCDDTLIVQNGYVTDTTVANVVALLHGEWFTPARCLLPGTKRARMIAEGLLTPIDIQVSQLDRYEEVRIINALREDTIQRIE